MSYYFTSVICLSKQTVIWQYPISDCHHFSYILQHMLSTLLTGSKRYHCDSKMTTLSFILAYDDQGDLK